MCQILCPLSPVRTASFAWCSWVSLSCPGCLCGAASSNECLFPVLLIYYTFFRLDAQRCTYVTSTYIFLCMKTWKARSVWAAGGSWWCKRTHTISKMHVKHVGKRLSVEILCLRNTVDIKHTLLYCLFFTWINGCRKIRNLTMGLSALLDQIRMKRKYAF